MRPAPVQAPAAPPPPRARFPWWIIPVVLLVLGGLAWLILAGLPFGGRDREPEPPRVETIAEGTVAPSSPRETGTIMDVEGERPAAPAVQPQPQPQPEPQPQPQPQRDPQPPPQRDSQPPPQRDSQPQPEPEPQPSLLSDAQASATLRDYVTSRDYYDDVADDCVRVQSRGFRNRGFEYEVWNSCERGGGSRLLGRWRVDALTREVFRQYGDGRYLRP